MKLSRLLLLVISVAFSAALSSCGTKVEWTPESGMDHQLFPSLLIATASVRPVDKEDTEAKEPDPYLLGDKFGLLGVSIKASSANAKVKVTIKENDLIATTV